MRPWSATGHALGGVCGRRRAPAGRSPPQYRPQPSRRLPRPLQATPLSTHVVLKLSKDLPIVVEYHVPDVGRLGFYLAPKVEEEEMQD